MKRMMLIQQLADLERRGVFVLTLRDIEKLFPDENTKSIEKSLARHVKDGLIMRAARGIYVNPAAAQRQAGWVIEEIAKALRPGKLCYVSLESMLSEYGVISQIPVSQLTVMTTGASGVHDTPYGVIAFTHTKRAISDILARTFFIKGRPLRIAQKQTALHDLRRVGRNTALIDDDETDDDDQSEP